MRGHRIFAALYDLMLRGTERAGLEDMRAELLAGARGRTLELGAGTGLNLAHYTGAVTELVLTEPDPHMAGACAGGSQDEPPAPAQVEVVEAPAERVPFEDGSFDSVVSTLVLCSVETPATPPGEIARVLKPEGRLLYLEHVRGPTATVSRAGRIASSAPGGGSARAATPTATRSRSSRPPAWRPRRLVRDRLPKAPPIVRPVVRGRVRRSR